MRVLMAAFLVALALWQATQVPSPPRSRPVERWRADLASPEASVRRQAVLRLGAARDAASTEALEEALADPDRMVRELAIWSLGRVGARHAVPALCDVVRGALAREREQFPVYALSTLGILGDPRALPTLDLVARDPGGDTGAREDALRAMGRIGTPEAARLLQDYLSEEDENVRAVALRQLAGLGPVPDEALRAVARDSSEEVLLAAADCLGGHSEAGPLLAALAREGAPEVRERARRAMALRRPLLLALPKGPEPLPETLALDVEDPTEANLEDFHPVEHGPLVMGRPSDLPLLVDDLEEGEAHQRCNAALRLGNMRGLREMGLEALRIAARDPDPGVRWSALKALGKQRDGAFLAGMLEAARDPDKDVREDAIEALGELGALARNPEVRAVLGRALHDGAPTVRVQGVLALRRVFPDFRSELVDHENDPDPYVQALVRKATGRIKEI